MMRADAEDFNRDFLAFYHATKSEVYGFLLVRSADSHVAEEVMAQTYLEAINALKVGTIELRIGWLITVAKRRLVDHWRRSARRREKTARLALEVVSSDQLDSRDTLVITALQSLPDRQRAAVSLRYLDELSVSEIADTLAVSYKSAESLLSRGRASLRKAYEELKDDY